MTTQNMPRHHPDILVTGSSGTTGSCVCSSLDSMNTSYITTTSKRDKHNPTRRWLDFCNPESYLGALKGIKKIFLLRPPAISNVPKYITPFLEEAKRQGVEYILFISIVGVEDMSYVPHYKVEHAIEELEFEHTFLRCGFFMQNFSVQHRREIKDTDTIYIPAGRAQFTFVDAQDIGQIAAICLTQDSTPNKLTITGPELIDLNTAANIFTEQLGRMITYKSPNIISFIRYRISIGDSLPQSFVMVMLYTLTRFSKQQSISTDGETIIGKKTTTLSQFVARNRDLWAQ